MLYNEIFIKVLREFVNMFLLVLLSAVFRNHPRHNTLVNGILDMTLHALSLVHSASPDDSNSSNKHEPAPENRKGILPLTK